MGRVVERPWGGDRGPPSRLFWQGGPSLVKKPEHPFPSAQRESPCSRTNPLKERTTCLGKPARPRLTCCRDGARYLDGKVREALALRARIRRDRRKGAFHSQKANDEEIGVPRLPANLLIGVWSGGLQQGHAVDAVDVQGFTVDRGGVQGLARDVGGVDRARLTFPLKPSTSITASTPLATKRGGTCSDTSRASTIPVACTRHWAV